LHRTLEKAKTANLAKDEILDILSKVKPKKLIFMGGEPTIDLNLVSLTKELKRELDVYNILLTNGYNLVDLFWCDEVCVGIKAASPRLHKEYTGKDVKTVFRNLKKLNQERISLRTESMFIPGYIDIKETKDIAYAISKINPNIPHRIDAYISVSGLNQRRPNLTEIKEAVKAAKRYLKEVNYIKVNKSKGSPVKILI
jgi:pyruvate-formate lyase-activating enzyme